VKIIPSAIVAVMTMLLVSPALGETTSRKNGPDLENVRSYAACTVRNFHDRSQKLVLADVDNKTMERKFGDIYPSAALGYVANCEELELRFRTVNIDPDAFRASVAEFLVTKDIGQSLLKDFLAVPPLTHLQVESDQSYQDRLSAAKSDKRRASIKKSRDLYVSRRWLSVYGECVVRKDATTTRDLLTAKPGSTDESSAILRIKPALGDCLLQGASLTFDRSTLRGTIAINYYRLAMSGRTSSVGSSK
jgi:hypothetical protein